MMLKLGNTSGRYGHATLSVALIALLTATAPGAAAEPAPVFRACIDAPTPQCVFGLSADAIAAGSAAGRDQLLAYAERPALLRLARRTIVGLAVSGATDRAIDLIRTTGRTAEERADLLLEVAADAPALARSPAARPLLEESLRTLDASMHWSAPSAEPGTILGQWLGLVRLCEDAGLHDLALASVEAARQALSTPAFAALDEAVRTDLALAVVRGALAAHAPALAEAASEKVSGSSVWTEARVEIAAEYARQDQTSTAIDRTQHIALADKQAATAEIFQSFLRRKWRDMARSSLLSLTAPEQARALVQAAATVDTDDFLAVLNVVGKPVQGIARAALVQRLLREGSYSQALPQATAISEPWIRLDAVAAVTTQSALAGDSATTRDARYWLDNTRWADVDAQEYFAAAFASAFSRVAVGDLGSSKRDLETLRTRLATIEQSGAMLAVPQGLDLLSFSIDALRMATGEEEDVLKSIGSSTPALFARAFAAGTAFGMAGARTNDEVAHALEAIASVEDANLRIGLLVLLGHQMQTHELLFAFDGSR